MDLLVTICGTIVILCTTVFLLSATLVFLYQLYDIYRKGF